MISRGGLRAPRCNQDSGRPGRRRSRTGEAAGQNADGQTSELGGNTRSTQQQNAHTCIATKWMRAPSAKNECANADAN
jgi:hypothetical protein